MVTESKPAAPPHSPLLRVLVSYRDARGGLRALAAWLWEPRGEGRKTWPTPFHLGRLVLRGLHTLEQRGWRQVWTPSQQAAEGA